MKLQACLSKLVVLSIVSLLSVGAFGGIGAQSAHAALITYAFTNGSPFDSSVTIGPTGIPWSLSGLTMKSEGAQGPVYRLDGTPGVATGLGATWDGIEKAPSTTNIITQGSVDGLVINGPFNGPGNNSNDQNRWSVAEEWTFSFDSPVIVREVVLIDFTTPSGANIDKLNVTIDLDTPANFAFTGATGGGTLANPFGEFFMIPAGTKITFQNPPLAPPNPTPGAVGGQFYHGGLWLLNSISVEVVPEPSSLFLTSIGLICFGGFFRRKRKR